MEPLIRPDRLNDRDVYVLYGIKPEATRRARESGALKFTFSQEPTSSGSEVKDWLDQEQIVLTPGRVSRDAQFARLVEVRAVQVAEENTRNQESRQKTLPNAKPVTLAPGEQARLDRVEAAQGLSHQFHQEARRWCWIEMRRIAPGVIDSVLYSQERLCEVLGLELDEFNTASFQRNGGGLYDGDLVAWRLMMFSPPMVRVNGKRVVPPAVIPSVDEVPAPAPVHSSKSIVQSSIELERKGAAQDKMDDHNERKNAFLRYVALITGAASDRPATELLDLRQLLGIDADQSRRDEEIVNEWQKCALLVDKRTAADERVSAAADALREVEAENERRLKAAKTMLSQAKIAAHDCRSAAERLVRFSQERPELFDLGDGSEVPRPPVINKTTRVAAASSK